MKARSLILAFLCALNSLAFGDVIRTEDGTIYIGKVAAADEKGVSLDAYGGTVRVAPTAIISTETGKASLESDSLEVHLKDGSIIRGRIKDYDQEVGLLVDIDFGSLTIPFESIRTIEDPNQRKRYKGSPLQAGFAAGYYWPASAGSLAVPFGSSGSLSLFADFNLQFVRGLSAGIDLAQFFMNTASSPDLSYGVTTLTAGPIYRLLMFRTSSLAYVNLLVPWASAGGGVAYISVQDRRSGAYQASYGEMDPAWCAGLGLDIYPLEWLAIRLSFRWLAVQQTSGLFHLPAFSLGAAYSF